MRFYEKFENTSEVLKQTSKANLLAVSWFTVPRCTVPWLWQSARLAPLNEKLTICFDRANQTSISKFPNLGASPWFQFWIKACSHIVFNGIWQYSVFDVRNPNTIKKPVYLYFGKICSNKHNGCSWTNGLWSPFIYIMGLLKRKRNTRKVVYKPIYIKFT